MILCFSTCMTIAISFATLSGHAGIDLVAESHGEASVPSRGEWVFFPWLSTCYVSGVEDIEKDQDFDLEQQLVEELLEHFETGVPWLFVWVCNLMYPHVHFSLGSKADSARSCISACRLTSHFQRHPLARLMLRALWMHQTDVQHMAVQDSPRFICNSDADFILEKPGELVPEPSQVDSAFWIILECYCPLCSVPMSISEQYYSGTMASPSFVELASNHFCQIWGISADERLQGWWWAAWKSFAKLLASFPVCGSSTWCLPHACTKPWFSAADDVSRRWGQRQAEESSPSYKLRCCSCSVWASLFVQIPLHGISSRTLRNW